MLVCHVCVSVSSGASLLCMRVCAQVAVALAQGRTGHVKPAEAEAAMEVDGGEAGPAGPCALVGAGVATLDRTDDASCTAQPAARSYPCLSYSLTAPSPHSTHVGLHAAAPTDRTHTRAASHTLPLRNVFLVLFNTRVRTHTHTRTYTRTYTHAPRRGAGAAA